MTISTTRIDADAAPVRPFARRPGFTLVEIMIGLTLGMIVLAGVMTSFLMLGRSGMNAVHYSLSETEIRRGIEEFSQDVRMASGIKWNSATSITLTVPDNYASSSNQVTYAWDSSTTSPTAQCFYRVPGTASSAMARTVFVRNVSAFEFSRFNRLHGEATSDAATKRVRISMNVRRVRTTLVATNSTLVSASYTLRNKIIN
jgi:Tfp pilus assembly protein PilW